ncbi:MAG: flagellum-specific ATP synthase FliI, partial [Candidatus Thiodiazotropha endolucinida]
MTTDSIVTQRQANLAERLRQYQDRLGDDRGLVVEGRLTRMVGLTLEAIGCRAAIGGQCDVVSSNGTH